MQARDFLYVFLNFGENTFCISCSLFCLSSVVCFFYFKSDDSLYEASVCTAVRAQALQGDSAACQL